LRRRVHYQPPLLLRRLAAAGRESVSCGSGAWGCSVPVGWKALNLPPRVAVTKGATPDKNHCLRCLQANASASKGAPLSVRNALRGALCDASKRRPSRSGPKEAPQGWVGGWGGGGAVLRLEKGWLLNQRGCGSAVAGRHAPGRTTQELAGARCRTTTAWLECRGCTEHAQKCREGEERAKRGRRKGEKRAERGRRAGGVRAERGRREGEERAE
jgi:hypothetical protein